ncbi:MAG: FHIPEP family type III secretion protein [Chlamydiia bacterium]|nr:FHIPEP family type III secretion protein [Chlamydiia bacterium]
MKEKLRQLAHNPEAILAIGVLGVVLLLVVPLPPICLDTFLSLSLVLSVMTLLLTLYVENALEFSAFPSLLLFLTLFRLGLNISSTRMILLQARAGDIISTFGGFVTKGSVLVGLILFLLLTIINFIVVTKGASRIAEVAARFTLEALPGRQMGIDAELNAGMINRQEAAQKRDKIAEEAEFYGAMDGASKFVRGDAIASIVITFVNIIGGLIIGIGVKHLSTFTAFGTYTRLTIGDGLVSQIPSLLISVGAGVMVTRASKGSLGRALPKQILGNPKVLFLAGALLLVLSFLPGMPMKVMVPISTLFLVAGWMRLNGEKKELKKQESLPTDEIEKSIIVHPLEIELGLNLIQMADQIHLEMGNIRNRLAKKLGIIVPAFKISDSLDREENAYQIKIKGIRVLKKILKTSCAIEEIVKNIETVVTSHAHELLNRQEVSRLVENARIFDAVVVSELIPKKLSLGQLLKVLQNLLKEGIAIRNFVQILEVLADHIPVDSSSEKIDPDVLSETVRKVLARGIFEQFFDEQEIIHAITLDYKVEKMILSSIRKEGHLLLRPITSQKITQSLCRLHDGATKKGLKPIVVTQPETRLLLRRIIERQLPSLPILSYAEVCGEEKKIRAIGKVTTDVLL